MKKIFLVIPNLTIGGAEKVYVEIVNNINLKLFDVYLVVFNLEDGVLKKYIGSNIHLINLNKRTIKSGIINFLFYLKKIKPDVVMSSIIHLNIFMAILKPFFPKKTKLICRNSNYYSQIIKLTKFSFLTKILYKIFINKFDFHIFISKEQRDDFLNQFQISLKKTKVINNPLNFKEILIKSKESYKQELFIKNGINFVVCGSYKYQKGFDIMIDAVSQIKYDNINVIILGGGLNFRILEIKKKIQELDLNKKITLAGRVENVFPYFKNANAIIIPSRFEGCCNVLIEALCLNKPIICTPAPGLAKELFDNSKGVLVAEQINSKSLAIEIEKFIQNKYEKSFSENIFRADISYGIKEYESVFLEV